jgi:hypothetical protein
VGRHDKSRKGAGRPSPGYFKTPKGPPGIVVSVKLPCSDVEELDRRVMERQRTDPYASRGALLRELALAKLHETSP